MREDIDILGSGREVLLKVEVFVFIDQPLDSKVVPSARTESDPRTLTEGMDVIGYVRNERKIGDGQLVANKVFLLGENALEDTQNTDDLLLVSFDGRWDLLSVVHAEPRCLAVVRSDIKKKSS